MCVGIVALATALILTGDDSIIGSGKYKTLGYVLLLDIVPFIAGFLWLGFRAIKKLVDDGTNERNWLDDFPSRFWPLAPVVLPFAAFMAALFMVIIFKTGRS
jgi:hypothetical protein